MTDNINIMQQPELPQAIPTTTPSTSSINGQQLVTNTTLQILGNNYMVMFLSINFFGLFYV